MYKNRYCLAKQFLKVSKSILSKFSIFKLFQSRIVVGRKEWPYWFVLAYKCISFGGWLDLVWVAGDRTGKYWLGTWINWFMNLNNNIRHDCFLRSPSDGHFKITSISVILSLQFLLHGLFSTKCVARCCIISNLWMDVLWYGSQIEEQYSI